MTVKDLLGLVIHKDATIEITPTWGAKKCVFPVNEAITIYSNHLVLGIGNAKDSKSLFSVIISGKEKRR